MSLFEPVEVEVAERVEADRVPGPSVLDVLPHATLISIFSFLSLPEVLSAGCVCTSFRSLSLESLETATVMDLTGCTGLQTVNALGWLSESHLQLKQLIVQGAGSSEAMRMLAGNPNGKAKMLSLEQLKIDGVKAFNDALLLELIQCTPNLQSLDISNNKVSDVGMVAIATHCPQLRRLFARDLFAVTNYGIDFISMHCNQLQEVAIDGCVHCSSESVISLASNCERLHSLSTAKCYKVTDRALAAFAPACLYDDVSKVAASRLTLRALCLRQNPKIITISLLKGCVNLESLDLTGCVQVTESELRTLLEGAGANMKHLALSGCRSITGNVLGFVGLLCPGLLSLKARGVEVWDEHLRMLADNSSGRLEMLNLTWCTKVTDEGLGHILAASPLMNHLEVEAVYLLTDRALRLLQRHAPAIRQLNIRMCHCLTADAIVSFAESTRVQSLHLSGLMEEENTAALVRRLKLVRPDCKLHS